MFGKYGPRAGIKGVTPTIGPAFASEYAEYYGKFGTRKLESFSLDEMISSNKKRNNFSIKDSA